MDSGNSICILYMIKVRALPKMMTLHEYWAQWGREERFDLRVARMYSLSIFNIKRALYQTTDQFSYSMDKKYLNASCYYASSKAQFSFPRKHMMVLQILEYAQWYRD